MTRSATQLRRDALQIWQAGVRAVDAQRLVREHLRRDGSILLVDEEPIDLGEVGRIVVVGAGKAGAGMAAAVEAILGERWCAEKQVTGWVNVPADCVGKLDHIHLHAARPAGVNEPTAEGVAGTEAILDLIASLSPRDLCLCVIAGGGSALLPAPIEGISLRDKQAVTQHLSAAGANIEQLNAVRRPLSRVKGGGLARACRAGRLITLIISDVIGDPLDVIASGPTVDVPSCPESALAVLEQFDAASAGISPALFERLRQETPPQPPPSCTVTNIVIGNNAVAVDAAGIEAESLGYSHAMVAAKGLEGSAETVGVHLAEMAVRMRDQPGPDCLITGGEPVVKLVEAARRGKGGRNQQLALAALAHLDDLRGIALLSGGTDGEDGPTDAAGALVNEEVAVAAKNQKLDPDDYLDRNDAYHFFEPTGGLIKTGPTHTNVCDLRVVVVEREERA